MSDKPVSTGRGGAGNIGRDPNVYTDAGIVREGRADTPEGPGEYSTGRGGAGNIGGDGKQSKRTDSEVIPDTSMKPEYANYHTGRGGEGNIHKDKYGGHSSKHDQEHANESIGTKVKHLIHGHHKEKNEEGS